MSDKSNNARRYCRKPVEAMVKQVRAETRDDVADWCGGMVDLDPREPFGSYVLVPTTAGKRRASDGDYVLKEFDHFRSMTAGEFEATYERAP